MNLFIICMGDHLVNVGIISNLRSVCLMKNGLVYNKRDTERNECNNKKRDDWKDCFLRIGWFRHKDRIMGRPVKSILLAKF